ncbi:siderophore-interacting protein [Pyxidicoccus fallax]|uniref:Siderophore-interacting protein n=1 Tax=Pyxidicoccus fallax TaxID=394095 RepID=A0A848LLZ1_9BACT|nr:siderophore-interacting protein [Pyxidicoccus fallax]NPC79141.1 siderophore-interacting protein [Pyxidicoccus fallax]
MTTVAERVFRRGPFPVVFRLLQVRRATRLTPHMMRITLGGEDLKGFHSDSADDHVKLLIPNPGELKPTLPTMGPRGVVFPEGASRPATRDYTPRRHDPVAGELDLDFVLHGSGPGSTWAANAKVGDFIGVAGPRGSLMVADDFDWYLFAGDQSGLPSIARRLEELPEGARAIVFLEVDDASEEIPLQTRANMELKWLHRKGAEPGTTRLLENAIRELTFPPGDYFAWAAGESRAMNAIRDHLVEERRAHKPWVRVIGYWKRGIPDHEEPHD